MANNKTKFNKVISGDKNTSSSVPQVSKKFLRYVESEYKRKLKEKELKIKRIQQIEELKRKAQKQNQALDPTLQNELLKLQREVKIAEAEIEKQRIAREELQKKLEEQEKQAKLEKEKLENEKKIEENSTVNLSDNKQPTSNQTADSSTSSANILPKQSKVYELKDNDDASEGINVSSEPYKQPEEESSFKEENDSEQLKKNSLRDKFAHKPKIAKDGTYLPPEESLQDNITDEEIAALIAEQEKEEEAEEEEEAYEGMSEEEIVLAKERRRRFKELQARYNKKATTKSDDLGDYRKNLDFTINTSIKRFRVKPPKKPIIISICTVLLTIIIGVVITVLVLNKPPEPIVLNSVKISQLTTKQYVGEKVDVRGIYIDCKYSDGSTKKIKATEAMISKTSSNIDANHVIYKPANGQNTYVYFNIDGFETRLDITVTDIVYTNITATIIGEYSPESTISFDRILVLAQTLETGTINIDPRNVTFTAEGITTTTEGIVIGESVVSGDLPITVTFTKNNNTFTTVVNVTIK